MCATKNLAYEYRLILTLSKTESCNKQNNETYYRPEMGLTFLI